MDTSSIASLQCAFSRERVLCGAEACVNYGCESSANAMVVPVDVARRTSPMLLAASSESSALWAE
eukprot:5473552-Prorocentrum_lima.AAC.1